MIDCNVRSLVALTLHWKFRAAGVLTLAMATLAISQSHVSQAQASTASGICRREAAEALTGKKRVTDARARRITGASIVRQIKPGQGVTMDYRRERVTIETDPKTGRIVRAYCG